jgi:hypothetical protein
MQTASPQLSETVNQNLNGRSTGQEETSLNAAQFQATFQNLVANIERVIVGKTGVVEGCLIGLLSGGHVLL